MHIHARSRRRRYVIPALVAIGGLLAASCGDDDDDGGAATTGAAEGTTAEGTAGTTAAPEGPTGTTAAPEGTTGTTAAPEGTEGSEPAGEGGAAEAAAIVEQTLQRPTSIELDTPIDAEIPTGLSLYFISCGAEACEAEPEIIQQATDILGWELTALSTDGSPQQIQNAWEQVVREQPDGVIYTATPRSQIEQYITEAAANGTAIAACCITDEPTDGIIWTTSTPAQLGDLALPMAAWVVNDAAEAGNDAPGVLYADIPDLPILSSLATSFEDSFGQLCPGCPYEKLEIGLADLQNADANIVSALRANTDIKYVIQSTDSVFPGLPAALSAAGLDDVKIFGEGPSSATLTNIENGDQAGTMAFAFYEAMFGAVDAIAREKAGVEVIPGFPPPNWILTADNIPSTTELFPLVPDIVDQFTALWGKS